MTEQQNYKPLPKLSIHPETKHLSQEDADRIFDVLCKKYWKETLEILDRGDIKDEGASLHPVHAEETYVSLASFICFGEMGGDVIQSKEILEAFQPTPQDELGILDLMFELRRRWVAARGYEPPEPKGKPLAQSPEGPFPEQLPIKPIFDVTQELGFTQKEVDYYVDQYFQNNKIWCYTLGEIQRREMYLDPMTNKTRKSIVPFPERFSKADNQGVSIEKARKLRLELYYRIWIACETATFDNLPKI